MTKKKTRITIVQECLGDSIWSRSDIKLESSSSSKCWRMKQRFTRIRFSSGICWWTRSTLWVFMMTTRLIWITFVNLFIIIRWKEFILTQLGGSNVNSLEETLEVRVTLLKRGFQQHLWKWEKNFIAKESDSR